MGCAFIFRMFSGRERSSPELDSQKCRGGVSDRQGHARLNSGAGGALRAEYDETLSRPFLVLAMTEFWERFSLAGVKSLLTLVLVDYILSGTADDIIGVGLFRYYMEGVLGPMSSLALASQLYGLTSALLYLATPLGGLLGDRLTGRRASVHLGGLSMAMGIGLMVMQSPFLFGLIFFSTGAGIIKGNLSVQVGELFTDPERQRRGYAFYLGFLNAGLVCGPFLCGLLALYLGWQWGFILAVGAIIIGLAGYHCAFLYAPVTARPRRQEQHQKESIRLAGKEDKRNIPALLTAMLAIYICYAAYGQLGNMVLFWARSEVDLDIGGWTMPVSWLLTLDGLITIMLIPAVQMGVRILRDRGLDVTPQWQIMLGCLFCMAGYIVLSVASSGGNGQIPAWMMICYLILVDIAVVLIWPSGLSLINILAPRRYVGFWVGLFYLHGFFAGIWVGFGGVLYDDMGAGRFWLLHAAIALSGAVLMAAAVMAQWMMAGIARRRGLING